MYPGERAAITEENNEHEIKYYTRKAGEQQGKLGAVAAAVRETGLPLDSHPHNWTLAENKIRNVDFKPPWWAVTNEHYRNFDPDTIRTNIAKLEPEKQAEANSILDELLTLEEKA